MTKTAKKEFIDKLVPDTSVIIEGILRQKLDSKELEVGEIILHEAIFCELEHQANQNREIGFIGLDELKYLQTASGSLGFKVVVMGKKPLMSELRYGKLGEVDSMIRDLAYEEDATLMTADKVQAKVAIAKGVKLLFIETSRTQKKLIIEKYFDETTMSVHIRENTRTAAKRGMPGNWQFVEVGENKTTQKEILDMAKELIEESNIRDDGFIEIERPGSTIIQLGIYRIVITRPPFSDGHEITAVRPVKRLSLEDYKLSEKLKGRIDGHAEGMLVAGAPGMGKTTFAQALAEHYASKKKIVKTVEAPRDLILPDEITQYSISHGDSQEIHDILLLSRPDYTIFDEMRNTEDFRLFADLRLSGIGFVGVVHATNPIDAIQRFVGRIELGVIPQVIDTVIFIKNGTVHKVLNLEMTVKVPSGMTEADLARPVVVVHDFETGKLEYELYSYGEETVVIPVKKEKKSPAAELAARVIEEEFRSVDAKVEMVSDNKCIVYVPEHYIAKVIGKQGSNIMAMEKRLGLNIDVQDINEMDPEKEISGGESGGMQKGRKTEIGYRQEINKKAIVFYLDSGFEDRDVDIYVGKDFFMTTRVSKTGVIKVKKNSGIGKALAKAIQYGENVKLMG